VDRQPPLSAVDDKGETVKQPETGGPFPAHD
jgi:hypothetical protein